MQSFLGLVGFCRKFMKNLSLISAPFYALLKKEVSNGELRRRLESEELGNCFESIKECISENVTLTLPNTEDRFILTTDASKVGIGAVLAQVSVTGEERVISFYSSVFSDVQQRYSATDQELLAVVAAIKHFKPYLAGAEFTLRSDHKALLYLLRTKNLDSRLLRWSLYLQGLRFTIEHVKGVENFADVLSRAFVVGVVDEDTKSLGCRLRAENAW